MREVQELVPALPGVTRAGSGGRSAAEAEDTPALPAPLLFRAGATSAGDDLGRGQVRWEVGSRHLLAARPALGFERRRF
jgi:hypothetical protein